MRTRVGDEIGTMQKGSMFGEANGQLGTAIHSCPLPVKFFFDFLMFKISPSFLMGQYETSRP